MKKIMSKAIGVLSVVLLAAAILANVFVWGAMSAEAWTGTIASSFSSGSGSQSSPYVINTKAQFGYFMNKLNSGVTYSGTYIKIGANLDLTGESWTYGSAANFDGYLDGQCYTIKSNCTILPDIGQNAVVQRINATSGTMESPSLLARDNSGTIKLCTARGNAAAGVDSALICEVNYGTVQYCGAVGSARGDGDDCDSYAGMVGMNKGTVDSCFSAMTVSGSASGRYNDPYYHPLTNGQWGSSTTAPNSYYDKTLYTATTTVGTGLTTTEMKSAAFLQLISGYTEPGSKWVQGSDGYPTLKSGSTATVSIGGYANQAVVPYQTSGQKVTLTRSASGTMYYTTDGTDPSSSSTRKSTTGSSVSLTLSGDMEIKAVMYASSNYGNVSSVQFVYMPGSGTASSPYKIITKKGLDAIRLNPEAHYILMADLTYTSADFEFGGIASGGWVPIPEFKGSFDATSYKITGLSGNRGGFISTNSGTIYGLTLIDHKLFAYGDFGAIATSNSGTITKCYVSSAFTLNNLPSTAKSNAWEVGGIVGINSGTITYCRNEGLTVFAGCYRYGDAYVGGICGYNTGTLTNCVNMGTVVLQNYQHGDNGYVGGIVGRGDARNCLSDTDFIIYQTFDYSVNVGGISGTDPYWGTGAFNCVADVPNVTRYASGGYSAARVYEYTYAPSSSDCYRLESNKTPADFSALDFTSTWMLIDQGPMVQGVPDAGCHKFILDSYTAPTCTNEGITKVKCNHCGMKKQYVSAEEKHERVLDEGYDATCTETGLSSGYHCSLCNKVLTEQTELEPLGHQFTTYVSNEDFTCTEDGTETAVCDRCTMTDKRVAENSAHHVFTTYVNDQNFSCTADGTETAKCENCDETHSRTLTGSKLPHSFTEYVSDGNATYLANGTETAKCDGCDATNTRTEAGSKIAPVSISVTTLPGKVSYLTGESLNLTNLKFTAVYENGDTLEFDHSAADSVVAEFAALSGPGKKRVTVTYMGCTADYEILVHELGRKTILLDSSTYPQSAHEYSNNTSETKTFTYPGAYSLQITFNSRTLVENSYDYIYVYNKNSSQIASFTGYNARNVTLNIPGDTFKVKLTSDSSVTEYGYGFSSIYAEVDDIAHDPVEMATTATCTSGGTTGGTKCSICDVVMTAPTNIGALGHSFTNYVSDGNATALADGTKTATCDRCDATNTVTDSGSKLTPVSISVLTPPTNVVCGVGEKPALDGLTLLATYETVEDVVLAADMVESYTAATGTAGRCVATVTYMGKSATFEVLAHDRETVTIDEKFYPESVHNYENHTNDTKQFTWEGAQSLTLTFSAQTFVEENYDFLYVLDGNGATQKTYTGAAAANATITIPGDTFYVKLTSDHSVQKWGYSFASIVANGMLDHPEAVDPAVEATCTATGLTEGSHCGICGVTLVAQEVTELAEHPFGEWITTTAPTCTETGEEYRECDACEHSETRVAEATGHNWVEATCTEVKTCGTCGLTEGEALGHEWENATCTTAKTCATCKATEGTSLGHDWKSATCTEPKTCDTCGATEGTSLGHDWKSATCTAPKTCATCKVTEGTSLGHEWKSATCTAPKTCDTCKATEGTSLGHEWKSATCTAPKTCDTCKATEGTSLGHDWKSATCTVPKTCATCKETEGTALGHKWKEATCTAPKTCEVCGENDGWVLDHNWKPATCTEPETCKICGTKEGEALGHDWTGGSCTEPVVCKICDEIKVAAPGHSWIDATCREPKLCEICFETEGEALDHDWTEATCTEPMTCKICGMSEGETLGHEWNDATCTKPMTCEICGRTGDNALGHDWAAATCTEAKTCAACGTTEGESLGHSWQAATCTEPKTCKTCQKPSGKALGHDFGDWETTTKPTTSKNGKETRECERNGCDHAESRSLGKKPTAPVLTVSSDSASGKPTLKWDAVKIAKEYQVYRKVGKDGSYKKLTTITGTTYTDKSAEAGKTYYYKVRAVSETGVTSDYSSVKSRTCDLAQPVVKATNVVSSGKIKLTWEKISGATKYEVYRATSKSGTYKLLKTTTGTSLTNTSTEAGKTYYYKVKAIHSSSAANSAYSAIVSRTCDLAQPTLAVKVNSNGDPKLTWTKVEGATKYEVYRATSKSGTYSRIKSTTGTSLTNTSVTAGKTYYYKVKAIHSNSAANSAYSSIVSAKAK